MMRVLIGHAMRPVLVCLLVVPPMLLPSLARAHSQGVEGESPWATWPFEPEILAVSIALVWFYVAGWVSRDGRNTEISGWRHMSFFAGIAALLIALQSPLDSVADHSFAMHQVQHLFLGAIGPILLMLAFPQQLLIAGMPRPLRVGILAPILASRVVRAAFGYLARPTIATVLAIIVLFFWHLPTWHDLAVLDVAIHYGMHFTFLVTGLFFFFTILDQRPAPLGAGYSTRIAMSLALISASTPLGAYLALKSTVLYSAYEAKGRLQGLGALQDEALGGLVMWVPGGIVLAVPMLIVIKLWGAREERLDMLRRRGFERPSDELPVRVRNRRLAWRLAGIAAASVASVLIVGYGQRFLP